VIIFIVMKDFILDKVMWINFSVMTLSFAEIESLLKIVLLIASIVYTIIKIVYNKSGDEQLNKKIRDYFRQDNKPE